MSKSITPRFNIYTNELTVHGDDYYGDDYGGFLVDDGVEYFIPGSQIFVKKGRYDSWRKTLLS